MANTNTALLPVILARSLVLLRKRLIMPRLVNSDYSIEAARKGASIPIPVPVDLGTADNVTPAVTPPTPTDQTPTTVSITLDKWKHKMFHISDKERAEIEANANFIPNSMSSAIDSIAQAVNGDIFALYKEVYGYTGTAATTPFATTTEAATVARKQLNEQLCPKADRRFVLDFDAEANALSLAPFRDVSQAGNDSAVIEGEIGRRFGFDFYSDHDVPTHTAGTGASYQLSAAATAGATSASVDTGTGTILVGDIVTFAGHTTTYTVTAALSGGSFSFLPALTANVADNGAIAIKATHVVNLAFNRDAFAFANRPLVLEDGQDPSMIITMQDPLTGISMRLEKIRGYKQTMYDIDILYGVKCIRPQLAVRVAG